MLEQLVNSTILYSLTITLFHFLWQGVLVGLALKCALTFIPLSKALWRYTASTIAMLANILLPVATFIFVYQANLQQFDTSLASSPLNNLSATFSENLQNGWLINLTEISVYISLLWLSTVTFLACKILIELYNVNQLSNQATCDVTDELLSNFMALVKKIGLKRAPRLLVSLKIQVPMAVGWLKPVVLIPASMISGLTPAQLDMLILHELAHIRRHDYLVNFLQTLVEILLFFHPCVHWVSKQMRNEREYCSDDIAVHHCGDPIAYAHTLADTATLCTKHRHMAIPNIAMAASGGDLKQRVVRLVNHHCTTQSHGGKLLASLAIISLIALSFSIQLMKLPVLDLSTGQLSLHPEVEASTTMPVSSGILAATTIAQQLLVDNNVIEANTPSAPVSKTTNQPAANNSPTDANNITAPTVATIESKSDGVELQTTIRTMTDAVPATPAKNPETTSQRVESTQTSASVEQTASNEKAILPAFEHASGLAALEKPTQESSQATLATNSYAKQIASLEDEPVEHSLDVKQSLKAQPLAFFEESLPIAEPVKQAINKVEDAQLIKSVDPKYPAAAKRRGIELDVMVHFTVDKNGQVKDLLFERKNKVNYFRSNIRGAINKWRFLPAQENGKPVESRVSKIFSFNLMK